VANGAASRKTDNRGSVLNTEIHAEAIEEFGEDTVREAINAWNQEILKGQENALTHLREVLGLD